MPVIRGNRSATDAANGVRDELVAVLARELGGGQPTADLLVYEVPIEPVDKLDVIVVWDRWEGVKPEDRSDIIIEAYAGRRSDIALALGVTFAEAEDQNLLPYAVVPLVRKGEGDPAELRRAMVEEGGVERPNGTVELRFPTERMAAEAHRRLTDAWPKGYWTITQAVRPDLGWGAGR